MRPLWFLLFLLVTPAAAQPIGCQGNCPPPKIFAECPRGVNPEASHALAPVRSDDGCYRRGNLPDPSCTPGAINPTVTLDVLRLKSFRTSCLRDKVTSAADKAEVYRWYNIVPPKHNVGRTQKCELDHLVPLVLGGADTMDNIWPECGDFRAKDKIEVKLGKAVRAGAIDLGFAQRAIAADWTQFQ